MINFKNLSKRFMVKGHEVLALDNVNLNIEKGDIFGVIGFSGAGKSTLLRMVNALEIPTSGSVRVAGININELKQDKLRDSRKHIGMVFQQFNLLESKTVFDNIAIPLVLNHTKKADIEKRVNELLSFVGLEDRGNAYPQQLSGGQKQRVGIARALTTNPEILLADEATSALDPDTTDSILNLLEKVNKELNVTIMFVTHEINVIKRLCNKVAVMEKGRVIETGTVLSVFSNPQSEMTKRFVGSVIPNKIPKGIIDELKKDKSNYKLLRIRFSAKNTTDDLIYQINTKFNVRTNVMFASVNELQGHVLSVIVLQVNGNDADINKVTGYIKTRGIEFEEITL